MTVARTEQRVMGFGTFKVEDGVAERSWTQMIGEAAAGEGESDGYRVEAVENSPDRAHILLQGTRDGCVPKDIDALRGGDC